MFLLLLQTGTELLCLRFNLASYSEVVASLLPASLLLLFLPYLPSSSSQPQIVVRYVLVQQKNDATRRMMQESFLTYFCQYMENIGAVVFFFALQREKKKQSLFHEEVQCRDAFLLLQEMLQCALDFL